jgi:DNA-binding response OmpR family regulator
VRPRPPGTDCRYIVVADEDRDVVNFVIETLLRDGHAVFQAYDGRTAIEIACGLKVCDLVISNTLVGGVAGPDLIEELRLHLPDLAIVFLASRGQSGPEMQKRLPNDVLILREPFTAEELRAAVRSMLDRGPRLVHPPRADVQLPARPRPSSTRPPAGPRPSG